MSSYTFYYIEFACVEKNVENNVSGDASLKLNCVQYYDFVEACAFGKHSPGPGHSPGTAHKLMTGEYQAKTMREGEI